MRPPGEIENHLRLSPQILIASRNAGSRASMHPDYRHCCRRSSSLTHRSPCPTQQHHQPPLLPPRPPRSSSMSKVSSSWAFCRVGVWLTGCCRSERAEAADHNSHRQDGGRPQAGHRGKVRRPRRPPTTHLLWCAPLLLPPSPFPLPVPIPVLLGGSVNTWFC